MDKNSRLESLEAIVRENEHIEPERLHALVFLAQSLGESYGYFFDVHHFRVFSRALEADINSMSMQPCATNAIPSDISNFVLQQVFSVSLGELELAAAYVYFEQKGYASGEIEQVLNPNEQLLSGAKRLMSELKTYRADTISGVK